MTVKDFLKKSAVPVAASAFLMALFYPLCVDNGICDYWKLWIMTGIPFGVHRMHFWLVPKGFDLGGTIGMFAFNLLIGGMIGSMVLAWRLVVAAFYLVKGTVSGIVWLTERWKADNK